MTGALPNQGLDPACRLGHRHAILATNKLA